MLAKYETHESFHAGQALSVERWAVLDAVGGLPAAQAVMYAVTLHKRWDDDRPRIAAVERLGPAGGADLSGFDPIGRTALLADAPGVEQEIHARYPAS
jgi:hypothetical protein